MAIELTRMTAEPLPEGWDWSTQLFVWGTAPYPRSGEMLATLGGQTVDGIAISSNDQGFTGYLKQPPGPTDTLVLILPGEEPVDTGLTLSADPPTS